MAKDKNKKKKFKKEKEIIKKIALWLFLIVIVGGMVFTYAITAFSK